MMELPRQIVLDKWEATGFFWQGDIAINAFERLMALVLADKQLRENPMLAGVCHLRKLGDRWLLRFELQGVLWLACHRCDEALAWSVPAVCELALLQNSTDVPTDSDEEYLLLSELGDKRMLPLSDLLEDELLLALPLAIAHDHCQIAIDELHPAKTSPFAGLAFLKK